jgi:hypothetical protein
VVKRESSGEVSGGPVRIEDLLGRRVRYKGEEGRIVEGHLDERASVVVITRKTAGSPQRSLTVPEEKWNEFEFLD